MNNEQEASAHVTLPRKLVHEIYSHAQEGLPEEVCGVIRGRGAHAYEVVRGQNIAEDRSINYTVDPQTLLQQFVFEEAGDEMMGIYHSHPATEAYPSATDAWNAYYPDAFYIICTLENPATPSLRAFRMLTQYLGVEAKMLISSLPFAEGRPGLFSHFITGDQEPPGQLAKFIGSSSTPLYIVYSQPSEPEVLTDASSVEDIRAVSVVEHPVMISPDVNA